MILAAAIAIFSSWIGFVLLQRGTVEEIIIGQIFIGIGVGSFVGPSHIFLQQQFSIASRAYLSPTFPFPQKDLGKFPDKYI